MTTRICIVCGKGFFGRSNKCICSFACKQERARQRALAYSGKEEPQWIKTYKAADRLTKIAMLADALDLYGIEHTSYGRLSVYWDTDKYKTFEYQVFRRKRIEEYDNSNNKNTIKGKDKASGKNRA